MNDLFIKLYLDEDVDVLVAELVRARGFMATTTVEAGQRGNSDAAQLAYAVSQHLTVLTHNRADFEALARDYLVAGRTHYGIVVAVRRSPYDLANRLLRFLNQTPAQDMRDQLRYL